MNPNAIAGLYSVSIDDCTAVSFKDDDVKIPAAPLTALDPDFHGVHFVGDEVWGLDQQGTRIKNFMTSITASMPPGGAEPEAEGEGAEPEAEGEGAEPEAE